MAQELDQKDIDHLNMQYLPRLTVPDADAYLERSAERSEAVRNELDCEVDVAYGDTPGQTLDLFPARAKNEPIHVFIHGGYWRALDKHFYSHVAGPMVAAGAAVVLVNYDLCPAVRITDIVDQVRRSIVWTHENSAKLNGDSEKIYVSGHSAGGHLTGMMAATDWAEEAGLSRDLIKGTAPLSGLFDIEPHRHTDIQAEIRLTADEAKAMSPMYFAPVATGPAIVAVGGGEPDLFHWQSLAYAAHLRLHGIKAEYLSVGDDNHFAITDRLGDADDPLTRALIAQMGL